MTGINLVIFISMDSVNIFDNPKIGGFVNNRTIEVVVHNHVTRHMFPLINCAAEVRFQFPGPRMAGLKGQFIVDIHLMPRYFIDPHHGPFLFQVVHFLPKNSLFFVNR